MRNVTAQFPLDHSFPQRGIPTKYLEDKESPAPEYAYIPGKLLKTQCRSDFGSVFLIESSRTGQLDRFQVRRQFGQHEKLNNFFFFVGDGPPNAQLAWEMKQFDDIIVGHFEDNYENLPTKTKFVYKTAVNLCHSEVDSYYMVDSDVLLGNVI